MTGTLEEARKEHVAAKFRLLKQVFDDGKLTPLCFHLTFALVEWWFFDEEKGRARTHIWRSQEHLAGDCRVTPEGIRKAMRRLVDRGHFDIEVGIGAGRVTKYFPIVRAKAVEKKAKRRFGVVETNPPTVVDETPNDGAEKPPTGVGTIPSIDSLDDSREKMESSESSFEASEAGRAAYLASKPCTPEAPYAKGWLRKRWVWGWTDAYGERIHAAAAKLAEAA